MKLIINQTSNSTENISELVLTLLYNLCSTPNELDPTSSFTGHVRTTYGYQYMADYISNQNRHPGLTIEIDLPYIEFKDANVLNALVDAGFSNGKAGITRSDALSRSVWQTLMGNTDIEYFDEAKFFKDENYRPLTLDGCTNLVSIDLTNLRNNVSITQTLGPVNPIYFMGENSEPYYLETSMKGDVRCRTLKYLRLKPDSTGIGEAGFYNTNLEKIWMVPAQNCSFGNRATGNADPIDDPTNDLKELHVEDVNNFWTCTFGYDALFTKNTVFYTGPSDEITTGITVPALTLTINNGIWYRAKTITSIDWNGTMGNILNIGNWAFGYSGIDFRIDPRTGNTIDLDLEMCGSVGANAFAECKLSTVKLKNVTNIGSHCFDTSTITELHISPSLKRCEEFAFLACNNLLRVNFYGTMEQWLSINFRDYTQGGYIASACSNPMCNANKTNTGAQLYLRNDPNSLLLSQPTRISFEVGTTEIKNYALCGCTALTYITIPSSLTTIGAFSLLHCNSLGNAYESGTLCPTTAGVIELPETVTTIKRGAFLGCDAITELILPSNTTTIAPYTFANCENLSEVKIRDTQNADRSTWNLNNVTFIDKRAFLGCGLSGYIVNLPNLQGKLEDYAFLASGVTKVTNLGNISEIGGQAFANCLWLTEVNIPASVTKIDGVAFNICGRLTTIILNSTTPPYLEPWRLYGPFGESAGSKIFYVPIGPSGDETLHARAYRDDSSWALYKNNITYFDIVGGLIVYGPNPSTLWS